MRFYEEVNINEEANVTSHFIQNKNPRIIVRIIITLD